MPLKRAMTPERLAEIRAHAANADLVPLPADQMIIDLLAHIDTLAGEWRPIDTAPRDGTVVLLYRYMRALDCHVRGYGHWENVRGIQGWITEGFTDPPGELGLAAPDCWQPIPAAPPKPEVTP